jgi:polysaccharide biosynthesis/export protein
VKRSQTIARSGLAAIASILFLAGMLEVARAQVSSNPLSAAAPDPSVTTSSSLPSAGSSAPSGTETLASRLLIGDGDLLKVSILGSPESDQDVRVSAEGNVALNFIGKVHVAGLTIEEAEAAIAKKLVTGGFYTDPQVSLLTKEYATQGISVLGEVQKPGVYPLLGPRRLFDALSLAGGTTPKAGRIVSVAHRDRPQEPVTVALSNDPVTTAASNIEVFPGDTVMVSKAGVVYVVGDVKKPTGVIMENGRMTVLQAISMAEGTNPNAALNKAVLIHNTASGRQETPLQLKNMLAAKAPDIAVQPDDIIFVPNSAAKSASKRGLEAVVQAAVGVAIYHSVY